MGNRQQTRLLQSKIVTNNKQSPRREKVDNNNTRNVQKKQTTSDTSDTPSIIDIFDETKVNIPVVPLILIKPRMRISSKTVTAVKGILSREGSDDSITSIITTVIDDRFTVIGDENNTPRLETGTISPPINSRQNSWNPPREQTQNQRSSIEVNNNDSVPQTTDYDVPIISATTYLLPPINASRRLELGTRERFVRRRVQMISPHLLPGMAPKDRKVLDVIEELEIPHEGLGHAFSFPNRKASSRVICMNDKQGCGDERDALVTVPAFKSFVSCRDLDLSKREMNSTRTTTSKNGKN